jgi:predicted AlkP superfamily pyrophosphatase or phosphodiesterase
VFWYAADYGFTTSRYYADTLPAFVQEFNRRTPIAGFANREWHLLLDEREYREADADSAEYDRKRVTFPHRLPPAQPELGKDLPYDPVMDSLTLALAWDGVRALELGSGAATDFLNVSLSTTDAVGHRYGPDSRELHDQVLRVDRLLGAFMDSLRARFSDDRVAIALTADHGVAPYPEVKRSYDPMPRDARFVNDTLMVSRVRAAIAARGAWRDAVRFDLGLLRVWRDSLEVRGIDSDSLVRELVRSIRATPGIASVRSVADLVRADTTRDSLARRWLHSIGPGEPATHVATLRPWSSWSKSYYANHGSPHDYDRRVPIVFYGPWFRAGIRSERIRVVDLAPTLARITRVPVLDQVDGRVVTSALR